MFSSYGFVKHVLSLILKTENIMLFRQWALILRISLSLTERAMAGDKHSSIKAINVQRYISKNNLDVRFYFGFI